MDGWLGPLLDALYAENDLIVGDNEPYSGARGRPMWRHGTRRGLVHVLIEVRQDLIRDQVGQRAWADRFARILRGLSGKPDLDLDIG